MCRVVAWETHILDSLTALIGVADHASIWHNSVKAYFNQIVDDIDGPSANLRLKAPPTRVIPELPAKRGRTRTVEHLFTLESSCPTSRLPHHRP